MSSGKGKQTRCAHGAEKWRAVPGTEMGNADGQWAGHAVGQIVRDDMSASEGRERPRRGGVRDRVPRQIRGSFTPRFPVWM